MIGEPETPAASAPRGELAAITSLSAEVEEKDLEPPLPAGIGAPETPLVSVLPATAQPHARIIQHGDLLLWPVPRLSASSIDRGVERLERASGLEVSGRPSPDAHSQRRVDGRVLAGC